MTQPHNPASKGQIKAALALRKAHDSVTEPSPAAGLARRKGAEANRRKADEFGAAMLPVIEALREQGHASCNAIAWALNQRGMQAARGGAWTGAAVRALLQRAGKATREG